MSEIAQIGVTLDNLKCLDFLKESKYFDELQDAARFAAVLAVRNNLYKNKDLNIVGSNLQTRWNVSLVDPDHFIRDLVSTFENKTEDLAIGMRSLIILGLDYIWSKIENGGMMIAEIFTTP